VTEANGHNIDELIRALSAVPDGTGKPLAIIAHTVKGKGVSFMEDDNNWHYRVPTEEEVEKARKELGV
jgi:transketolase